MLFFLNYTFINQKFNRDFSTKTSNLFLNRTGFCTICRNYALAIRQCRIDSNRIRIGSEIGRLANIGGADGVYFGYIIQCYFCRTRASLEFEAVSVFSSFWGFGKYQHCSVSAECAVGFGESLVYGAFSGRNLSNWNEDCGRLVR